MASLCPALYEPSADIGQAHSGLIDLSVGVLSMTAELLGQTGRPNVQSAIEAASRAFFGRGRDRGIE